jgi:hypothetical protein
MQNKSLYETHYEMLLVQLENLETDLEGYAGRNWQDEYKNYNNLSTIKKINVVSAALEQYKD